MKTTMPTLGNDSRQLTASGGDRVQVVACGPGWVVVNKPCGMSIHNNPGSDLCSFVLEALRAGHLPNVGPGVSAIHAVHRLDRDTSGMPEAMLHLLEADR